jgi:hypothetical protein
MVELSPFDETVARMCSTLYDTETALDTIAWKVIAAATSHGLFLGIEHPAERDRLLASHAAENVHTRTLNEGMRMFNEVVASPQAFEGLTSASQRVGGRSWALAMIPMLIDRFSEVHGPLDESRRMPQFAALINHGLRFGLMLSRDHPDVARKLRAEFAALEEGRGLGQAPPQRQSGPSAANRGKPWWKFWG